MNVSLAILDIFFTLDIALIYAQMDTGEIFPQVPANFAMLVQLLLIIVVLPAQKEEEEEQKIIATHAILVLSSICHNV